MALTLHNYFEDYPKIVKRCEEVQKYYSDGSIKLEEKIEAEKNALLPLVDSDNLFKRHPEDVETRDKIVYVFIESSDSIRQKKVNDDFSINMPVAYIGMGTIERPLNHWENDPSKVNTRLQEWIRSKQYFSKYAPYLVIYSSHMSDEEAKQLEADLISQVIKIQSPIYGIQAYKSTRTPIRLFNSKEEISHQKVYSIHGKRQK